MACPKTQNLVAGIVVAAVLVAACAGYAAWRGGQAPTGDADAPLVARAHDADGKVTELPLDADATVTVSSGLGDNVLVTGDGAVHVESATCDNKDCIHQGSISRPGQQIICLPTKMWVEVVHAGDADGQMDAGKTPGAEANAASGLDATAR